MSYKVYPNPTEGLISLEVEADSEGETLLRVVDLLGREVYQQTVTLQCGPNHLTFDLKLSSGMYVLKINNFVAKIIRK